VDRRILLLVTDLKIGGTPTVVREVAVRLNQLPRVRIHVACLDGDGPVGAQIRKYGIPVTALNASWRGDLLVIRRLVKLIRHEEIDTTLSFLVHANAIAAVAAPFCPAVRFLQSIQTTQPQPRWHWKVQRWASASAELILVPSISVAQAAHDWSQVPNGKIAVIPNGVDRPPAPSPGTLGEGRGEGLSASALRLPILHRVVFIGRLDPIKRLPDLIEAMRLLKGFARLDIYGDGPQRQLLENQIAASSANEQIQMHGAIPSPWPALKQADVLVLCSEAEGFGLVLIEAMAAGVPVVATDVPGIRDVVRHRDTGLLVPAASPAALAAAIRCVLEDQGLRQSLIDNAKADVRRRFTWDAAIVGYRAALRI